MSAGLRGYWIGMAAECVWLALPHKDARWTEPTDLLWRAASLLSFWLAIEALSWIARHVRIGWHW